jgi:chromosome partitioning protein
MITVIANLKGGTGKSTVTFNLAVWLCSQGRKITVIDLDPQQTLTDVAALRQDEGVAPPIPVQPGPLPGVSPLRHAEETLIDVGTADLESFKQALLIADRILIPVTPSQADVWSTQRFVQFLYKTTNGCPPESITFINRADTNKAIMASDEAAAALTALPGVELIPQRLSDRMVFRDSFSEGLAVFELEPRSVGSREFEALAKAVFNRKRGTVETPSPGEPAVNTKYAVDKTVKETLAYVEDKPVVASDASQADQGKIKRKKKKHRTAEGQKAGKGKKRKRNKDAKKDKKETKGKKAKKDKKGKKAKKRS